MKRHTCVVCKKKRNSNKMVKIANHWACNCIIDNSYRGMQYAKCCEHSDFDLLSDINSLKDKMELLSYLV